MDNIITWNVRGMNALNKQTDVQSFCWRNDAGLARLVEAKVRHVSLVNVTQSFQGMQHFVNHNAHGNDGIGRIWVMWR